MMLFSRRKSEAEALVDLHPNAATFSERDRWVFVAGAMMGMSRGYDLGTAEAGCARVASHDDTGQRVPEWEREFLCRQRG